MISLESLSLKFINHRLQILDQSQLPHREEWVAVDHPEQMVVCIQKLQVRGAPLIGVAAALSLAQFAQTGISREMFQEWAQKLRAARPTAVNLMAAIDELLACPYDSAAILEAAVNIFRRDHQLCEQIANFGSELISDGENILTHCNTGGLATAGVGTALGIIRRAHEQGKRLHVFVDETRPLLQGGRLTTWELKKLNIPHTLICDNMAATLMAQGRVQKVIVGADRIATNGDFANKVGTYGLAVLSYLHRLPFVVAAPYTTLDFHCRQGADIEIEQRPAKEVRGVEIPNHHVEWAPADCAVYNPAFDVTPHEFVSHWVLDQGVFLPEAVSQGALANLTKG